MIEDPILVNDWHMVAEAEDLNRENPLGVRLLGEDLVLWRSGDGTVHAWKDLCLHRGTRLSLGQVVEGKLECPYHGWIYSDEGRCVKIPAHPDQPPPKRFTTVTYEAREQYDGIWVCLGESEDDIPVYEEWYDDTFRVTMCGPYEFQAAAPRVVENFLDVAHFPYVHEGILGDRDKPQIPDFEVERTKHGIRALDVEVWQPDAYGTGEGSWVDYDYETKRPFTAYLAKKHDGQRLAILACVHPIDLSHSRMWMYNAVNYNLDEMTHEDVAEFCDSIALEDVPIVESQRPELLPLDLAAELHRPSDRCSIAYRKWLSEQGVQFGTS